MGLSGRTNHKKSEYITLIEPVRRYRYCHFSNGASSGIYPTTQAKKPLNIDEKYAKMTEELEALAILEGLDTYFRSSEAAPPFYRKTRRVP